MDECLASPRHDDIALLWVSAPLAPPGLAGWLIREAGSGRHRDTTHSTHGTMHADAIHTGRMSGHTARGARGGGGTAAAAACCPSSRCRLVSQPAAAAAVDHTDRSRSAALHFHADGSGEQWTACGWFNAQRQPSRSDRSPTLTAPDSSLCVRCRCAVPPPSASQPSTSIREREGCTPSHRTESRSSRRRCCTPPADQRLFDRADAAAGASLGA